MPYTRPCAHKTCKTNSLYPGERGKMFYFPRNDDLRETWIKQLDRNDLLGLPYNKISHYRVCINHFEDKDFCTAEKKKLLTGRIPKNVLQDVVDEQDVQPQVENVETLPRAFSGEEISTRPSTPRRLSDCLPNRQVDQSQMDDNQISPGTSGPPTPRTIVDEQPINVNQFDQPEIENNDTSSGASSFEFSEEDISVTPPPHRFSADAASELRKELGTLRVRVEQMDIESKTRDDEIKRLQAANIQLQLKLEAHNRSQDERVKDLQQENAELQAAVLLAQAQLEKALADKES